MIEPLPLSVREPGDPPSSVFNVSLVNTRTIALLADRSTAPLIVTSFRVFELLARKSSPSPSPNWTVPPLIRPPNTRHEPDAASKVSSSAALSIVPVSVTVPPERVSMPISAVEKVPPKDTVESVTVIVPSLSQLPPRVSDELVAVIVRVSRLLQLPALIVSVPPPVINTLPSLMKLLPLITSEPPPLASTVPSLSKFDCWIVIDWPLTLARMSPWLMTVAAPPTNTPSLITPPPPEIVTPEPSVNTVPDPSAARVLRPPVVASNSTVALSNSCVPWKLMIEPLPLSVREPGDPPSSVFNVSLVNTRTIALLADRSTAPLIVTSFRVFELLARKSSVVVPLV